jgi:hypothetical protein
MQTQAFVVKRPIGRQQRRSVAGGRQLVSSIVQGHRVAIEVIWTGALRGAVPQRNYDYFEPW